MYEGERGMMGYIIIRGTFFKNTRALYYQYNIFVLILYGILRNDSVLI